MKYKFNNSFDLYQRAMKTIPGGIWGHNKYPGIYNLGNFPLFVSQGEGPYFWDVDGNRYIDYLCGSGAMISGYANPIIDNAAQQVFSRGDCFNHPSDVSIKLAEYLCNTIENMAWCAFGKNGSDATSIAVLIARAATNRKRVVAVADSYHGSHFWCNWNSIGPGYVADDSKLIHIIKWNDAEGLLHIFKLLGPEIACVILPPYHHPIPGDSIMPSQDFWNNVEKIVKDWGSLLILDDVRAGFRLDMAGSHKYFGFTPDITCFSKALANTYPLSTVCGTRQIRQAAESVFISGTFWNSSAPMAAALENLKLLANNNGIEKMFRLGKMLTNGICQLGIKYGFEFNIGGPLSMPSITIQGDNDFKKMKMFAELMIDKGSFIHPMHNWFLSTAHTERDIEETLNHAELSLRQLHNILES